MKFPSLCLFGLTSILTIAPAQAATLTQIGDNLAWDANGTWVAGAHTPSLENDYFTSMTLRTPTVNSSTFGGASLTIQTGGNLFTKSGASGTGTIAISNLTLEGGRIRHTGPSGPGGALHILQGGLTITGSGSNISPGTMLGGSRDLQIDSILAGTGSFDVGQTGLGDGSTLATNSVIFTNSSNTFSGDVTLVRGMLQFAYDFSEGQSLGSLTLGDTAGKLILSHDLTVMSLTIGGTALGAGIYDYNTFSNLNFGDYFVSGSGSITVQSIPEPGTFLLGAMGVTFLLMRRRRR